MGRKQKQDAIDVLGRKLKQYKLNLTPQRIMIYREFAKAKDHPTAEAVLERVRKKLPTISFDTVYRTLDMFHRVGIADIIPTCGGAKRFDPTTTEHYHFKCIGCGLVMDIHSAYSVKVKPPKNLPKEFAVQRKRILYEGLCDKCKQ